DTPDWDQRGEGFARVVGFYDPDNPVIDIGAYEVQGDAFAPHSGRAVEVLASLMAPKVLTFRTADAPLPTGQTLALRQGTIHIPTIPKHTADEVFSLAHRAGWTELADGLGLDCLALRQWSYSAG